MDMLTITNACCSEFCHFLLDSNWVFFRLNFQCKITFFLSPLFLVLSFVSRFQVTGAEAQQKKGVGSIAKIVAFCLILHNIWKPNQAQACNQYITYIVHLKHEFKEMICWTHGVGYSLKLNRHGFDCRWQMKKKKKICDPDVIFPNAFLHSSQSNCMIWCVFAHCSQIQIGPGAIYLRFIFSCHDCQESVNILQRKWWAIVCFLL